VFDQNFNPVSTNGSFSDPNLPSGFAPFNVQNINGQLFVTYAKYETGGRAGNGFIDVFSPSGTLVERLASGGPLNMPWGMTVAPQSFGSFSGALLVGNNGDGHISAYDPHSGAYLGQLTDNAGNPLAINNLWGLTVGNDHLAGNSQTVFFTEGIDNEQHGLFGAIQDCQGAPSGTAGTLPYDPNSDDDDYPLPPTQGPSLGGGSVQPTPSPVLLPVNNSSFVLAPTLAISSELPQGRAVSPDSPTLYASELGSTPYSTNPVVAIGTITGPGTLPSFLVTSPLELTSSNRPTTANREFDVSNTPTAAFPLLLLLLDYGTPEDSGEKSESTLQRISSHSDLRQPSENLVIDSGLPDVVGSVASGIPVKSVEEATGACFAKDNQSKTAGFGAVLAQEFHSLTALTTPRDFENLPATPFHARVLHGFFLALATCVPWNQCRVSENSVSKLFEDKGILED
jgi:hypothetical protein